MSAATETLSEGATPQEFKRGEDRCDRCNQYAQARLLKPVVGKDGQEKVMDLLFCNHHYKKHLAYIVEQKWEVFLNDDSN